MNHCSSYGVSCYLDGDLRLPDRRKFEAHLRACERCSADLEAFRRLDREVRAWGQRRRQMPVQSEMRILESVDRRRPTRRGPALGRMMPAAVGSSIAALLVLVIANVGSLYPGSAHMMSPSSTTAIQRGGANQTPLALDVVRVHQITGQRISAQSDAEVQYRHWNRGMINLD